MNALDCMNKKDVLVRDLLRDFCTVQAIVAEQANRFSYSGTISYPLLRELLGEAQHKGIFWSLKDTAHHLFRRNTDGRRCYIGYGMEEDFSSHSEKSKKTEAVLESLIDWCIGYAFHECVKLKEDAFQKQHYTNRLLQVQNRAENYKDNLEKLIPFTEQTTQSIAREMERVVGVLKHTRDLLVLFLGFHGQNGHLARFIIAEEDTVRQCFAHEWQDLIFSLYGENKDQMYICAIKLCLQMGNKDQVVHLSNLAIDNGVSEQNLQALVDSLS